MLDSEDVEIISAEQEDESNNPVDSIEEAELPDSSLEVAQEVTGSEDPESEETTQNCFSDDNIENIIIKEQSELKTTMDDLIKKVDYLDRVVYTIYKNLDEKTISQDVLLHFDETIRGQMQLIRQSAVLKNLTEISELRERLTSLINKMIENKDALTIDTAINNLLTFDQMIEELLIVNGVVSFSDEVGSLYEYPKHNKRKIIDTDNVEINKTIANVSSRGYMLNDVVILPEIVDVYRYVKKGD